MYRKAAGLSFKTRIQTNARFVLADLEKDEPIFTIIVNAMLDGEMTVHTTEQCITNKEGGELCVLPWWVDDMPSSGSSILGNITMGGNEKLLTTGVIRQNFSGHPFPATLDASVFNVFEIPGYGKLHHKYPVIIEGDVDEIPPFSTLARCKSGALLFNSEDKAVGYIGGRAITLLGPV